MNALGSILTLLFALAAFCLPRRGAALAVVAAACYITQGQMIIVGGFHFTTIRIVLLAGIFRGLARGEMAAIKVNAMDKAFVLYVMVSGLLFILRSGTSQAAVSEIGIVYNMVFAYFTFRCLLTDCEVVESFLAGLAILSVPLALLMVFESNTGQDVFASFGGLDTELYRDGHFRCSGPFRTPITAGTLGATLLPLFIALYWGTTRRRVAVVGMAAATLITLTSRSSGPAIEYLMALGGFVLWRWRQHTQLMRRGFVITLIGLHLIMKAPVWFLMARVSDLIGGGGWHRAAVIDQAVKHFWSWWIWGTGDTGDWMATQLKDGSSDLTNQFVAEGVAAGLLGMFLFIWIIVRGFQRLGAMMKQTTEDSAISERFLWGLGVTLFATVVNFFSISYFDQINVVWWLLVAIIAGVTGDLPGKREIQTEEETGKEHVNDHTLEPSLGTTPPPSRAV